MMQQTIGAICHMLWAMVSGASSWILILAAVALMFLSPAMTRPLRTPLRTAATPVLAAVCSALAASLIVGWGTTLAEGSPVPNPELESKLHLEVLGRVRHRALERAQKVQSTGGDAGASAEFDRADMHTASAIAEGGAPRPADGFWGGQPKGAPPPVRALVVGARAPSNVVTHQ